MSETPPQSRPQTPPLPDPSGLEDTLSPVDLPGEAGQGQGQGLRWTTIVIAAATLTLLPLNATALRGWAYELKPTPLNAHVVAATERWYDVMAAIGLTAPVETMHGWWQGLQSLEFGGSGADAETPPQPEPAGNGETAI